MASLAFVPRKIRAKGASHSGANSAGRPQLGSAPLTTSTITGTSAPSVGGGCPLPSGLILKVWLGRSLAQSRRTGCSDADIVASLTSAAERLRGHSVAYVDLGDDEGGEWIHLRCQSSSSALSLLHALNEKPGALRAALTRLTKSGTVMEGDASAETDLEGEEPPPIVALKLSRGEEETYFSALPVGAKRKKGPSTSDKKKTAKRVKRRVKRRRRERNEERAMRRRRRRAAMAQEGMQTTATAMDLG